MLFSILIGSVVYILAQFLWYSPWGFGSRWRRLVKVAPTALSEPLALPDFLSPTVRQILLPAVIVSFSLHVFRVITAGLGLSGFFLGTGVLWYGVVIRKYFKEKISTVERQKWLIEDGALLSSLALVALSVVILEKF